MFADASYKNDFLRTKFYGTFFIDEMSVTSMLEGVKLNAIAYTIGATTADPVFNNSNLTVEYSRLNPFVYMNSNDAQLYTNNDYQLGHWIGSNADQLYVSYTQKILRGLELSTSIEWIRRGQEEDPEDQYKLPYPEFLYGERRDVTGAEVRLSYEFVHDLFLKAYYHKLEDENIGLAVYYGL